MNIRNDRSRVHILPAMLWMVACAGVGAYADDTASIPRTHVDSTVVGDAVPENPNAVTPDATLDNDHAFHAGAPEIVAVTKRLNLSPQQDALLKNVIQNADAGAAALIRRENAVTAMISSTNPEDPRYPKLMAEHTAAPSVWQDHRDKLRSDVLAILTPVQRARFEKLSTPDHG